MPAKNAKSGHVFVFFSSVDVILKNQSACLRYVLNTICLEYSTVYEKKTEILPGMHVPTRYILRSTIFGFQLFFVDPRTLCILLYKKMKIN